MGSLAFCAFLWATPLRPKVSTVRAAGERSRHLCQDNKYFPEQRLLCSPGSLAVLAQLPGKNWLKE